MTVDNRLLDPTIAAWLAEGLDAATPETRRAIAAGVERTRQRRPGGWLDLGRRTRLLAVAALLVALAALGVAGGGLRLLLPNPSPSSSPTDSAQPPSPTALSAMLDSGHRRIEFSYVMPEGLDVTQVDEELDRGFVAFVSKGAEAWASENDELPLGAHGIAIADVTGATEHGSLVFRPVFGATAGDFLRGLDASAYFVVEDVAPAIVGGQLGWSARVRPEGDWWTHIDVYPSSGRTGSLEFGSPNVIWVTDIGEAIVAIEVWADTAEGLAAWLPRVRPLVDSIRFQAPPE